MAREERRDGSSRRPDVRVALVAATLFVWTLAGCAGQPIIEKPVPSLTKEGVLSILNDRAKGTGTLSAKLAVKVRTSGMRGAEGCDGSLAAGYPDLLRIRGHHDMLDYPPFDIGSDGTTWFVHTHVRDLNEMHLGPTRLLEEHFAPGVPLTPGDIVLALGLGQLRDDPSRRELLFTRHPGFYLITEVVSNASGRYVAKRITVDPELMVITRMETYQPDGAIDMVAEMTYDRKASAVRHVPAWTRIRLLRKEALLLELTLRDRKTGVELPEKVFKTPSTAGISPENLHRHDSR